MEEHDVSLQPKTFITPEEYLENERKAEFRSEYHSGEVFAMAGASRSHIRIVSNLMIEPGSQLKKGACNIYSNDMKVHVPPPGLYLYTGETKGKVPTSDDACPDVVVTCGDEGYLDDKRDVLLNPVLIIEVLSESTESCDRGEKFARYQSIDSLQEYLLVARQPYRIERYTRRSANEWIYTDFRHPDDVIRLESIECELVMRDLYLKV
jgi:Uma2 family endonuclease